MGFLGAALFGGPTAQEKSAAAQTNSMANALQGQYQTEFGQYENVANQLQNNLSQELLQGEQGEGLTAAQMAPLQTAAINSAGQNFTNAQIAEQTREAGLGGGGGNVSGLQSGVESQIQGQIAAAGANALTNAQIGIANENTNVALQKQQEALGGLAGLAGGYQSGALSAAGQELGQNKQEYGQASDIQEENQQQLASIGGGVAGLLGAGSQIAGMFNGGVGGSVPSNDPYNLGEQGE